MKISEKYADYILEETKKLLEIDSPSGYTKNVAEYVMEEYHKLGYKADMTVKGGVLVDLGGEDESNAVMLDTHIDTLGGMVSEIKADGNLRIVPIGGLNANNTEAENVRVVTRDGKIYTSAGVSAGMDMSLGFIGDLYGMEQAEQIAQDIEYIWNK